MGRRGADVAAGAGFEGKVAVVTGGAGGIGRATAELLAAGGARVLVADVKDREGRETVERIVAAGGVGAYRRTDVTVEAEVEALMAAAVETYGRLDIGVNNAGIAGATARVTELSFAAWRRTMDVNLHAVFLCMRAEIPRMLTGGGGTIVNTSSAAGLMGFPGMAAYVSSKHGVIGLTKTAALEHARDGIRINAVCPGGVRTPMLEAFAGSEAALEAMGQTSPMRRLASPDEIAAAIVWLCSDAASFVTGTAMSVDGGVMAT
jgi:NAD(P)-dependent dehydrogenase (short-subunit alcohol dehydrogenase family)